MYNKYFTMKRSELKEAIKAEIKSVLSEEEKKFQMTYKGDPVHITVQGFGGNEEGAKDTVLFVNVGGIGKRKSKASENALEKRLGLLDKKVDKIMFTDKNNISKEIKNISKDDFKITSVLLEGMSDEERENRIQHLMRTGAKEKPLRKLAAIGKKEDEENLKEVYQTNSKMSQIVSLFQDMMDDEYDGMDYRKALNDVLKAIDDDYKAAEREGEKFSRIREAKSAADVDKEVKDLESKMKDKAKDFKSAEGKAKDKIKDELKDMTTKRNDLKKKVEDLKKKEEEKIADKGRDQELDT